ncbi:MAG: TlpA family protein disulfide reductase [Acidimicrobiales bacterium]
MATNPPADLMLASINGPARSVRQWLTTFHLLFVAVDPGNDRSTWIVPTAGRVLTGYEQADCRVAWLVTATPAEARRFLGRWASEILTFTDPDFAAVRAFGLGSLPAIVHVGMDGTVVNAVEGWDPIEWRRLTAELSRIVSWSRPSIPMPTDPGPFSGAPLRG